MSKLKGTPVVRKWIKLTLRPSEDPAVARFWAGIQMGKSAETVVMLTRAYLDQRQRPSASASTEPESDTDAVVDAMLGML